MKKNHKTMRFIVLLTAVVMIFSLAVAAEETGSVEKEPITLTLLTNQSNSMWNQLHDSSIQQYIKDKLGITLEVIEADDNKFRVILAGGDLPDMVRIDKNKYGQALVEGNHILVLDDLIEAHAPDMQESIGETLDFIKVKWSERFENIGKDNHIYFIPVQVGLDAMGMENTMDVVLRWDYYKEIGAPEIKTPDDMLNVLAEMVKNHPTTKEGKKVYGVSMWNDWGNWMYNLPMYPFTGLDTKEPFALSVEPDSSYTRNYNEEDGLYWTAVKFYYKANKMGLLDPDAFTMKYADFEAKATAGQILYGPANWPFQKFNQQHNQEGKGFLSVPLGEGTYQWNGDIKHFGWAGTTFSITKDCKYPERAMELLNFLWSYEGARIMYSGIEGVHWNMVDGKPVLTDETIEAYARADEAWERTNIDFDYNIIGLSPYTINPDDGKPLNLFKTSQVYKTALNPLFEDYSNYYGVSYPAEIFKKRLEEGKSTNKIGVNPFTAALPFDPPATDLEKRKKAKLIDLMSRYAARCVLAKSDEEFDSLMEEAIEAFENTGIESFFQRRYKHYEEAKEVAKQYMQ